ncbi:Metallo-dependent hydrolase [Atractiella rhizophila]|nr:Metallo-dependent hydrolase [Atractiella rhizophila]
MSTARIRAFAIYGTFVHSVSLTELEFLQKTIIGVDSCGVIEFIERNVELEEVGKKVKGRGGVWNNADVLMLPRGDFVMPGLVDTHTHAPQAPNIGYGQQHELLDWLTQVTFPQEKRFENEAYAFKTYSAVVQRFINSGTTTCCYYGSIHLEATKILARICHRKGQRAFVGKCNMDRNGAIDYVEKSASQSVSDTKELIRYIRTACNSPTLSPLTPTPDGTTSPPSPTLSQSSKSSFSSNTSVKSTAPSLTSLVQPILTPRFAISCSDALMASLNSLVLQDPTLPIQTHLAENPDEIEFTRQLFPFADSYTHIYHHFGLLQENTILAHCVHLDESELQLIKERGCGISHCPTSNFNLRSGTTRVGDMLDRGIKVGIGTDISGGFGMGVLTALRQASIVSKVLAIQERDLPLATLNQTARGRSKTPIGVPASSGSKSRVTIVDADNKAQASTASLESSLQALSPLDAATATTTQAIKPTDFGSKHLSLATLVYLATMGGAEVCCLSDRIGNFKVGKEFDALLIEVGQKAKDEVKPSIGMEEVGSQMSEEEEERIWESIPDQFDRSYNPAMFVDTTDGPEKIFEKFLFVGDDRNIGTVFVRGRVIGGARPYRH